MIPWSTQICLQKPVSTYLSSFSCFCVFDLLTLLISVYIFQRARRAMRKMEPETSRGWWCGHRGTREKPKKDTFVSTLLSKQVFFYLNVLKSYFICNCLTIVFTREPWKSWLHQRTGIWFVYSSCPNFVSHFKCIIFFLISIFRYIRAGNVFIFLRTTIIRLKNISLQIRAILDIDFGLILLSITCVSTR